MKGERAHSGSGRDLRVDRFDLIIYIYIITASKSPPLDARQWTESETREQTHTGTTDAGQSAGACKSWPSSRSIRRFATASLSLYGRADRVVPGTQPRLGSYLEVTWKLDSRLLLASSFSEASRRPRPPRRGATLLRHPRLSALATALRGGRQLLKRALEHLTHVAAADEQEGAILAAG